MKVNNYNKGKVGEKIAKQYYLQLGYEVYEQNYRYGRAEIDLITAIPNHLLVFVEVKYRSRLDYGNPETFVTAKQQNHIKEAAENYILQINWLHPIRFDIVALTPNNQVKCFEDAF